MMPEQPKTFRETIRSMRKLASISIISSFSVAILTSQKLAYHLHWLVVFSDKIHDKDKKIELQRQVLFRDSGRPAECEHLRCPL
jgi:hypothetical protein